MTEDIKTSRESKIDLAGAVILGFLGFVLVVIRLAM